METLRVNDKKKAKSRFVWSKNPEKETLVLQMIRDQFSERINGKTVASAVWEALAKTLKEKQQQVDKSSFAGGWEAMTAGSIRTFYRNLKKQYLDYVKGLMTESNDDLAVGRPRHFELLQAIIDPLQVSELDFDFENRENRIEANMEVSGSPILKSVHEFRDTYTAPHSTPANISAGLSDPQASGLSSKVDNSNPTPVLNGIGMKNKVAGLGEKCFLCRLDLDANSEESHFDSCLVATLEGKTIAKTGKHMEQFLDELLVCPFCKQSQQKSFAKKRLFHLKSCCQILHGDLNNLLDLFKDNLMFGGSNAPPTPLLDHSAVVQPVQSNTHSSIFEFLKPAPKLKKPKKADIKSILQIHDEDGTVASRTYAILNSSSKETSYAGDSQFITTIRMMDEEDDEPPLQRNSLWNLGTGDCSIPKKIELLNDYDQGSSQSQKRVHCDDLNDLLSEPQKIELLNDYDQGSSQSQKRVHCDDLNDLLSEPHSVQQVFIDKKSIYQDYQTRIESKKRETAQAIMDLKKGFREWAASQEEDCASQVESLPKPLELSRNRSAKNDPLSSSPKRLRLEDTSLSFSPLSLSAPGSAFPIRTKNIPELSRKRLVSDQRKALSTSTTSHIDILPAKPPLTYSKTEFVHFPSIDPETVDVLCQTQVVAGKDQTIQTDFENVAPQRSNAATGISSPFPTSYVSSGILSQKNFVADRIGSPIIVLDDDTASESSHTPQQNHFMPSGMDYSEQDLFSRSEGCENQELIQQPSQDLNDEISDSCALLLSQDLLVRHQSSIHLQKSTASMLSSEILEPNQSDEPNQLDPIPLIDAHWPNNDSEEDDDILSLDENINLSNPLSQSSIASTIMESTQRREDPPPHGLFAKIKKSKAKSPCQYPEIPFFESMDLSELKVSLYFPNGRDLPISFS